MRRLVQRFPIFKSALGYTQTVAASRSNPLKATADEIRALVYKLNKKYAAKHGEDLFKLTNETTKALADLEAPTKNKRSYAVLVDALYFLIYEGSGACKRLGESPPEFAMDVKFLRTSLRHDVDHGDPAEIRRKMRRAGETFRKYSEKLTPDECGQAELLSVQRRLLSKCLEMLKILN